MPLPPLLQDIDHSLAIHIDLDAETLSSRGRVAARVRVAHPGGGRFQRVFSGELRSRHISATTSERSESVTYGG